MIGEDKFRLRGGECFDKNYDMDDDELNNIFDIFGLKWFDLLLFFVLIFIWWLYWWRLSGRGLGWLFFNWFFVLLNDGSGFLFFCVVIRGRGWGRGCGRGYVEFWFWGCGRGRGIGKVGCFWGSGKVGCFRGCVLIYLFWCRFWLNILIGFLDDCFF